MQRPHKCAFDRGDAADTASTPAGAAVFTHAQQDDTTAGGLRAVMRVAPRTPALAPPPRATARKRLWETAAVHHCVLLGAAFDGRELRQILRRARYAGWETASDYELHSSAVSLAAQANEFSRRAQRKLDERYEAAISAFRNRAAGSDLLALWQAWVRRGEAVAAYWAAITDPACDAAASEALSREMHMLAHTAFMANRSALRRVRALEDANASIAALLGRSQAQCRALRAEATQLRAEARAAQAELRSARDGAAQVLAELERWRSGDAVAEWRARSQAFAEMHAMALAQLAAERRSVAKLSARITWLEKRIERAAAGRCPMQAPAEHRKETPGRTDATAMPDLTDKCVLCVGGKPGLVPHYRALVERAKGAFLYHDGGVEDHLGRLPALLSSAHVVVCFSGDVSHAAYHAVKRYCKVREKPCALIPQPSVHAAMQALAALRGQLPERMA